MITVHSLNTRLKKIETMGDTDARLERAARTARAASGTFTSSHRELDKPKIRELLIEGIFPHANVINTNPKLSRCVQDIIRKMFDPNYWAVDPWWGGYFGGVASALGRSSLSFAGQLLEEAINSVNSEPNTTSDVLHAYYTYLFKNTGILDEEAHIFLRHLFGSSFTSFGLYAPQLDNIGNGWADSNHHMGVDWKARHFLLPFPQHLQTIFYPMASGNYMGHQTPALATLMYFQRSDFVQTLKELFASTVNFFTVSPSELEIAALTWRGRFWRYRPSTDLLIARLSHLIVTIRHLIEDEEYGRQFELHSNSGYKSSYTETGDLVYSNRLPAPPGEKSNSDQPLTPEFLAEVHRLALELIPG